jgi:hypothetical protein
LSSILQYLTLKPILISIDDKNIEFTSNKLENLFKRTLPKGIKKLMKCKNDAKSRMTLRIEIWDLKNFIKI